MITLRKMWQSFIPFFLLFFITTGGALGKTIEIPFNPANFPANPLTINNPYWPLAEGSSFSYRAVTDDECEFNKLTVTYDTYFLNEVGVNTRVIHDQEWVTEQDEEGNCDVETAVLVEDTLDYHAQDIFGNVWYFGEDTWAYDDETEQCTQEGSWEAGKPINDPEVEPARGGIIMLANPEAGLRYQQEYLEDEAEDWGKVKRINASVSIDFGDFDNCLVTKEWTPLEPGEVEHKYYCLTPPGHGLVFIEELKEKTVYVEYIGANLPGVFPGENDPNFPAAALGCDP